LAAPAVGRYLHNDPPAELVHVWAMPSAVAAWVASRSRRSAAPLVVELSDPSEARRSASLLRILAGRTGVAIACGSQTVRRRLIEGGVPPDVCVVIRPGVDFALINRIRKGDLRQKLGIAANDLFVLIPEPNDRRGGYWDAFWAATLLNHVSGGIRVVVPGRSPGQRRIRRFFRVLPDQTALVCADDGFLFEELIAAADVLVVPAHGDVSTTDIAWAMAAGAAVIGSAEYSIAELIAHKLNGLLFKAPQGECMTLAIVRLLEERDALRKVRETARGHAYEVFGVRRYIDQHVRLYENLLSGAAPAEGIVDSAAAG
jgi:glycosyltransferase involved in cell wall biosynthesis